MLAIKRHSNLEIRDESKESLDNPHLDECDSVLENTVHFYS